MKKLLLFASLVLGFGAQAQNIYWTEYATSQPAASTGMRSISIVDDNTVWLSNSCGTTGCTTIRRYSLSTDSGVSWTTNAIDLGASAANLEIANICGVSATTAFASVFPKASGALGGIWKTTDAGLSWARQATASFNSADGASFCNLVHFWDENNGVTMGDPAGGYFEIYTTTNGGSVWTRVPSGSIPAPIDAAEYGLTNQFTVTGDVIWIGTTFGRILKSTDHGLTWTVSQSPIPDFGGGINGSGSGDMAFSDANNGLLQTDAYELFSTADGGANWTALTVAPDTALKNFGISEIPGQANTYISVGEDLLNSPARGSAFSTDGGNTWTHIADTDEVDGGVVAFRNSQVGFCSGFSTSAAVGGIWKWNGVSLANTSFSADKLFTAYINNATRTLQVNGKNISNVAVYDVLGKQVFNGSYTSVDAVSINVDSFNSGVYMVKVANAEGNTSTIKVIKQ
ncbi:T9SS type A sorting domain-containing protein [Flavobacterium sp. CYK-55]|uniref:T9SS type A sorting domain-containing protein n=1 Tax=Flavobacterium sp. CYK-55 TaxID=2835529 RepID=UPI001BCCEB3D|nr:T9SS type A sorting domain-containing protein [Flavobacterium sp. CYK-55]MBS7785688.1 T9SS type A sorting domain-containing protein [Flavobacterium sp. CYK-55]